jgi:hypothetical protein
VNFCTRSRIYIAAATGLFSVAGLPSLLAAQSSDSATDNAEARARQAWRETMYHVTHTIQGVFMPLIQALNGIRWSAALKLRRLFR